MESVKRLEEELDLAYIESKYIIDTYKELIRSKRILTEEDKKELVKCN